MPLLPSRSASPHTAVRRLGILAVGAGLLLGLLVAATAFAEGPAPGGADAASPAASATPAAPHGPDADAGHGVPHVNPLWMIPFGLLLASIALVPLISMHFWEHNYPWFALVLGTVTGVYYMFFFDDPHAQYAWLHEMKEYISFIALLGSLYVVSGGIMIEVSRRATPLTNTTILLAGAVMANIVGTTGAAMLLIRPYIRINRGHIRPYHIVFFIFIVANCGGCLTPIGDPPLFMGYLKGIPFFWVIEACWPMWIVCVHVLLVIFFIVDSRHAKTNDRPHIDERPTVGISGIHNFLWIGTILVAVFQPSMFELAAEGRWLRILFAREVGMVFALIASLVTTRGYIYERNEFTYTPIKEVAILFVGIFSTMVPALNYLNLNSDQMPLESPGQYYYVTGTLSAVLDNAPTYLVFLATKQGEIANPESARGQVETIKAIRAVLAHEKVPAELTDEQRQALSALQRNYAAKIDAGKVTEQDIVNSIMIGVPEMAMYLIAISVGAVFFGACTYIGNGPNFMVKSIAESAGICMPSFFGYVFKFALPILIPVYVLVWFVFFVWLPSLGGG